jgi:chromosomal replication initiation ATPase DnaA
VIALQIDPSDIRLPSRDEILARRARLASGAFERGPRLLPRDQMAAERRADEKRKIAEEVARAKEAAETARRVAAEKLAAEKAALRTMSKRMAEMTAEARTSDSRTTRIARREIDAVAKETGVPTVYILGDSRRRATMSARKEAIVRVFYATGWSMAHVAAYFGYVDHSTVRYILKKHAEGNEAWMLRLATLNKRARNGEARA